MRQAEGLGRRPPLPPSSEPSPAPVEGAFPQCTPLQPVPCTNDTPTGPTSTLLRQLLLLLRTWTCIHIKEKRNNFHNSRCYGNNQTYKMQLLCEVFLKGANSKRKTSATDSVSLRNTQKVPPLAMVSKPQGTQWKLGQRWTLLSQRPWVPESTDSAGR